MKGAVSTGIDGRSAVRTAVWSLLAFGVAAAVLSTVGTERLLRSVVGADRALVLAVASLLFAAICCRGVVLWLTLRAVGAPVGVGRGVVTYLVVGLVNTVVPGGGAGGTPLTGLVVARSADTEYEVGVTATVAVSTLSNVVVGTFGVVGLLVLLVTGGPRDLQVVGWLGVGVFVGGVVGALLAWRLRHRLGDAAVSWVATLFASLDRWLPWSFPDRTAVRAHADTFGEAVDSLVDGPPTRTAALLGLSAAAHLMSILALFLAFASLDVPVSVGVLLAVVPTAVLGGVTPAPAAGGGVEMVLGVLLASATGHPAAAVGAAVLIYRGTGYAFRLVLGAVAALVLVVLG